MKRREFLKGAAAAGAVAAGASSFPAPALSQGLRELAMVTTWPKSFPGLGTSAQRLADRIGAMSQGKIRVKLFAAGELVPPFESFDAVASGMVDAYHGAAYYWQNKSKAFNFFTAVPFGLTATELNAWIYYGGGQELWDELAADFNLTSFLAGNTGVQMGGWFNKEIHSLKDFKGLNIHMPGLGGEVLRRLGATAVALPAGEIFPSLRFGDIDASEWMGPWNDLVLGLYKAAKSYYYPGFHEPGVALDFGLNRKLWESLSSDQQAMIRAATQAENDLVLAEFNARNGAALETLRKEHGVRLRRFSPKVLRAIGKVAGEVVAEVGASDAFTRRVYESFIRARRKSIAWSRFADQAYWEARLLPFRYSPA
ncbi:MAG: TRAP transporter substrate-binding protein [Alphaproteobacteria bacterium]